MLKMQNLIQFFQTHLNYLLLSVIILSGIFVTKYTKEIRRIKNVYKVLITSIVISTLFYFINDCTKECLPNYLLTYLFATSFYEVIVKFLIQKITSFFTDKK